MEQKQRALVLRIDDAKQELVGCVNNIIQIYGLSPYLIQPIFEDLYSQIKMAANNELASARENEAAMIKSMDNGAE